MLFSHHLEKLSISQNQDKELLKPELLLVEYSEELVLVCPGHSSHVKCTMEKRVQVFVTRILKVNNGFVGYVALMNFK